MTSGITVIYGVSIPSELIFKPIAQLAGHGQFVFVIDGENSFQAYRIASFARTMRLPPQRTLEQVRVSRAFTCYQLTELVVKLTRMEIDQCAGIVCLGLLNTFYDEDVTLPEAQRLLQQVMASLKSLAEQWSILITVRPPNSSGQERRRLLAVLMEHANVVRLLEHDQPDDSPSHIQLLLPIGRADGPH